MVSERQKEIEEKKNKIRARYSKGPDDDAIYIPAKPTVNLQEDTSLKRVAAYCRVSTDDPNQTSSFVLQKEHYEKYKNKETAIE